MDDVHAGMLRPATDAGPECRPADKLTQMETAYVDESQIGGTGHGGPYVMVASIILEGDPGDVRRELTRLKPNGGSKLHWYSSVEGLRRETLQAIQALPLMHWAVVMDSVAEESPERTRRKCIERLLWELAGLDTVGQVLMESRGPADNKRDVKMVDTLKASRAIPGSMKVDHLRGRDEPLLWLPDAVCGAVGARVEGDNTWARMLDRQLWICP